MTDNKKDELVKRIRFIFDSLELSPSNPSDEYIDDLIHYMINVPDSFPMIRQAIRIDSLLQEA
jgi:hypothetical protein